MIVARTHAWINDRCGFRPYFWGVILAAVSVVLCGLPLVNVLGYDFAFAVGLVAAFAGADVGHGVAIRDRQRATPTALQVLAGRSFLAAVALLVLPLLLSLGNALRVKNCNLGAGFAFFALLPLSTALCASQAGMLAGLTFTHRRRGRVIAWAIPALSLAWSLWRVYRDPAIFALDPFGGYFPGPIYDEALTPSLLLVLYRLSNLTYVAAALLVFHAIRRGGYRAWAGAVALLAASALWFGYRGQLGFHTTHADLARLLPMEIRTEHFIVRAAPGTDGKADLDRFVRDLEFRYHQLRETLDIEPALPVAVYRFPDAAAKKAAVGAAGTLFTKPWAREIYVHADAFPARHLRHELAHIFASAFGDPIFGIAMAWRFPFPRLAFGLVEGVAEAADADDPTGPLTLHERTLAMRELGRMPSLAGAMGVGFTVESGPRAYTAAGSFTTYLLEQYGPAPLRAAYRSGGDYQAAYGKPLQALIADYDAFLSTLPKNPKATAMADESFRRPAIFGKVCARELAARVANAYSIERTFPAEAARILEGVCADDPAEPSYALDLTEAYIVDGQTRAALATLDGLEGRMTAVFRQRAYQLRAIIAFGAGDRATAKTMLEKALADVGTDADERTARAQSRALAGDPAGNLLGRAMLDVKTSSNPKLFLYLLTEFARLAPGEALGPYLIGRQLLDSDAGLAAAQFRLACPVRGTPPLVPLEGALLVECRRLLGKAAYLADDPAGAAAAFRSINDLTPNLAERLRARVFLDRLAWENSRR